MHVLHNKSKTKTQQKTQYIYKYMEKALSCITHKNHKGKFRSTHPCRLITPCKIEIGKFSKSKSILENINRNLLKLFQVSQWRNLESVI